MVKIDPVAQRLFDIERDLHEYKELEVTSSPLKAAAFHIGSYCKEKNDRFMACKQFNGEPAKCYKEGIELTNCVKDLFNHIGGSCPAQFTKLWRCLEMNEDMRLKCRDEELVYNECMVEKLGVVKRLWKGRGDSDEYGGIHEPDHYPEKGRQKFIDYGRKSKIPYEE